MTHDFYIRRCIQLAKKAGKDVGKNPQVGAVLVYDNRIIGEGFHQKYGGPHAEVLAIRSVIEKDQHLIKDATLYVSLEPCCIVSKTPACSDLILKHKIKKLVVSCKDPNPKMAGQSLELLEKKGVHITSGILEHEGLQLIKPFEVNLRGIPYVTLKWAKSKDHFMGKKDQSVWLSNESTKIYVHKLRSEYDGILIGTNTAKVDNPQLTTRLYPGSSPTRVVIDKNLTIPRDHHVYDNQTRTIIITAKKEQNQSNTLFVSLDFDAVDFLEQLLKAVFELGIYRLIIEGGQSTLRHFIKQNRWNEAHIIHTPVCLTEGTKSPLIHGELTEKLVIDDNEVFKIVNNKA